MSKLHFITLFVFLSFTVNGQTKYEKEIRMSIENVSPLALQFVDSLSFNGKVKWYQEFGLEGVSIEAKTKYKGKRYSIEFGTDGTLQDVEIQLKWKEVPQHVQDGISKHLASQYKKYKIRKIQVQYLGERGSVWNYVKNGITSSAVETNYELVISARDNRVYKQFELLFSHQGGFIKAAEIILENNDTIEY